MGQKYCMHITMHHRNLQCSYNNVTDIGPEKNDATKLDAIDRSKLKMCLKPYTIVFLDRLKVSSDHEIQCLLLHNPLDLSSASPHFCTTHFTSSQPVYIFASPTPVLSFNPIYVSVSTFHNQNCTNA